MADKKQHSKELGFGQKSYDRETRLITKEGEFNVVKKGMSRLQSLDTYHELINLSWLKFILLLSGIFFLVNLVFALVYFVAGSEGIAGPTTESSLNNFLRSFYFSTQTITTVGFGHLSPNTDLVSILAAFESFLGLLGFALATGLMFARFSRPPRGLAYSSHAVVAPYRNGLNGLMFRFINSSNNQLIEAEVDVVISYWSDKEDRRIFKSANLERKKINFFSNSWTVVHPIDEESPLFELNNHNCKDKSIEVIIMFKAFDDTYVRPVYDRMSYVEEEIKWAEKYIPMFEVSHDGKIHIDMEKLSATIEAPLN